MLLTYIRLYGFILSNYWCFFFFFFYDISADREIGYREVRERWQSKFMDCTRDSILLYRVYSYIHVYIYLTVIAKGRWWGSERTIIHTVRGKDNIFARH
jgi:hypothetical protein